MDELPELLVETVGGETVAATVDLGGGDVVAVTPTRTHLYRSEGLLSDESVETYAHDVERFAIDHGRRKTTLRLQNLDDETSLTLPASVVDEVVAAMLEGILRTAGVVDDEETVEAQFRFSELTLVVTDRQLLKHIGSAVWDDEFEAYHYADLDGLDFEEGSVATQVVVEMDGRQQRVKVPNDHAGRVRQEVQSAVFEFHGVSSLGGLRAAVAEEDVDEDAENDDGTDEPTDAEGETESDPEPGVDDGGTEVDADDDATGSDDAEDGLVSADWSPPADQDMNRDDARMGDAGSATAETESPTGDAVADAATADGEPAAAGGTASVPDVSSVGTDADGAAGTDVEALAERVDALAERVDHQTELIEAQQETIEQLVEELRRGR
ncbi:hypothetical protein HWV07_15730 [Natronomonas salina]|uniref:DUF7115 domain-containing protein n=1 Tax=Natronomonas salina TaxID=1710540 RepID=UPI0015B4076A|nr:hypothetical protein [Natronomonas salina]QLD90405.1 hypothetical protein HWV07_15730 [Natronomonas salina]